MGNTLTSKKTDGLFLVYVGIIIIFGLVVLLSASSAYGYSKFGDTYYFVKRQLVYGILPGLALFLIFFRLNTKIWQKISWSIYFISILGLIAVFIPSIGADFNKYAKSWVDIGFIHFQPAEFAKLALIIISAKLLSDPERDFNDFKFGLLPILITVMPLFLLVMLQPDLGTLIIMAGIFCGMLYLGKIPKTYLTIIILSGVVAFTLLAIVKPYRMDRLTIFLHPELDPQGIGYHVNQAYLAVGSGGFWGLGLGHSRQKHQYLPEVHGDSIYAIVAEELGFIISLGLIILILLISWRCLKIAKESSDKFNYLLIAGIAIWFFWQSFINIGAMIGILPLTGVTLPFVSHGGSSMMVCLAAVGITASVSKRG